jgi:hypothetical protein
MFFMWTAILISLVAQLALAGFAYYYFKNWNTKIFNRLTEMQQGILRSRRDIQGLCIGSGALGERIEASELEMKKLFAKQQDMELNDSESVAYKHAAKLIEMGVKIEEVVERCGLKRTEVELMLALQKKIEIESHVKRAS